ncbi:hypothetical protein D3C85_1008010 [compost metagenome]
MELLVAPRLPRLLGRLAEAIRLDALVDPVCQRTGVERREQMKVRIVARVLTHQPIQLFSAGVRSQLAARTGDAGKGRGQALCLLGILTQGRQGIAVVSQQQRQQRLAVVLQREELVDIQRRGIAHHIAGKVLAQAMAAHQLMGAQLDRQTIQVGAFGIRVNRLERMSHRLDLPGTPRGFVEPCGRHVLGEQGGAFGIIVAQAFELGGQAFGDKAFDQAADFILAAG